jgi:hypothetical protein
MQGELGSTSGRALARETVRTAAAPAGEIKLRELQG